jgi:CrcB protein
MAVGLADNRGKLAANSPCRRVGGCVNDAPGHGSGLRHERDGLPDVDPDVPRSSVPAPHRARQTIRERWDILLVISAGGALGSLARWGVGEALPHDADQISVSTWLENVSGAFLLGVLMVCVIDLWPPQRYVRPFLGVGVLGGYTTFSTYMLDSRSLLAAGEPTRAALYLFGTLATGLIAVWVGIVAMRGAMAISRRRHHHREAGASPEGESGPSSRRTTP